MRRAYSSDVKRELREILAAFSDARAGRGRRALLMGEPGIGKSRLADELAAHAQAGGATVLWGRCWEAGGAPAYWPWVQALRTYVRDRDHETLRRHSVPERPTSRTSSPTLRDLLPRRSGAPRPRVGGARFRLFDAVATFLRNASDEAPLVLVLDDLHVADAPSLLMLQFVAGGIGEARVTLLGIYRDPDPDRNGEEDVRLDGSQPYCQRPCRAPRPRGRRRCLIRPGRPPTSSRRPRSSTRSCGRRRATRSSWARLSGSSRPRASSIGRSMPRGT